MVGTGGAGPDQTLCTIVCAAGASTRFGNPKQLARVAGEPFLLRAIIRATEAATAIPIVVVGAGQLCGSPQLTPREMSKSLSRRAATCSVDSARMERVRRSALRARQLGARLSIR